jgi:hypothetical protein
MNRQLTSISRRRFVSALGFVVTAAGLRPLLAADGRKLTWQRDAKTRLFTGVSADGAPLITQESGSLLTASARVAGATGPGPLRLAVEHRLRDSGAGQGEDTLEATLTVRNTSDRPQRVEMEFATAARPSPDIERQSAYAPLSAAGGSGDKRFAALGVQNFLKDCNHAVGTNDFVAHYLEPMASFPAERETRALLLAPVVDVFDPQRPWRIGLFTPSELPMRFSHSGGLWRAGRQVIMAAGATLEQRCWLVIHQGDAAVAWRAFHRFGHREEFAVPEWAHKFKVHYYDFLSSAEGKNGRRGEGYESDLPHLREFRVGLATQHGYYPAIGDFIHPDRQTWQAMRGDKQGAAEMSLEKVRARIKATRAAGAKAAIYLHAALFDDAAACFPRLRDVVQVDASGQLMDFGWTGPDTVGKTWRASLGAAEWRAHLLQQAGWIMELLRPDAIVMDETFAGLGYEHHPNRPGPTSAGAIDFYRKLRALVHSFGRDKAFFTSDCSMSPFVLWADGECGDHAYSSLLGHPLYTQEPVRYLAALGDKPWRPCAWHFHQMWAAQIKLARQVGAGVGVSNGWLEYTGLTRLPGDVKARTLADIATLFKKRT